MLVLEQMKELERAKYEFSLRLNNAKNDLKILTRSIEEFNTSIEYLESRTSKAAKNLLDTYRKDLQKALRTKKTLLKVIHSLEAKISDLDINISTLTVEDYDPINEQLMQIINAFFDHVKINFKKLVKNFHTTYKIEYSYEYKYVYFGIREYNDETSFSPSVEEIKIINSEDGSLSIKDYYVHELYSEYVDKFYHLLKTKLVEENPFKDTFMITFNEYTKAKFNYDHFNNSNITFTLELL